jgi:uncharacterized protein
MFIDIHCHAYRKTQPTVTLEVSFATAEQIIARYDELDIDKGVLMPVVSPEVYLPQSNDDILEMAQNFNGRFIPFCNVDPRALTNSAEAPLGDLLRYYKDIGFKGFGEAMFNLPFLHPLTQNLLKHVEDVGFPFGFHMADKIGGVYGLYDEIGLPQLEKTLQKFPNLKILGHSPTFWSQIGQIETPCYLTHHYPTQPIKEEGVVPKLLRCYEHLYGDLSAMSGYGALARDKDYAIKFLTEFQDKLFYGTDISQPDFPTPLAGFLLELCKSKKISTTVFNKIARENAIKLLDLES